MIWQRGQAHFRRNVADHTPARLKDEMHQALDGILGAISPQKARAAFDEAAAKLEGRADAALAVLEGGWEDATAVLALPAKYRRRLRTADGCAPPTAAHHQRLRTTNGCAPPTW